LAIIETWIQLENRSWDVCPSLPIDRMRSAGTVAVGPLQTIRLTSPITGASRTEIVNRPVSALILRRYTKGWRRPDDRKVNPWDLNEPDPSDAGTMGTIPGPILECEIDDTLVVHFRNLDMRTAGAGWGREDPQLPPAARAHSLHAHGVSFPAKYDGAYPLSPPDQDQPIPADERALWNAVGVNGPYKQGDRVPPGATFTYRWQARGPASAGVWVYHDHSIDDMRNTALGAIGLIVIRNPADTFNEVQITPERLPGRSWVGSPLISKSVSLDRLKIGITDHVFGSLVPKPDHAEPADKKPHLKWGPIRFEVNPGTNWLSSLSLGTYREPPDQALYLLLFHELEGAGMCINGRQHLGNAPTLVAGPTTRMRFGVAGMGETFHTFHIHGHRWVLPGPSGTTPTAIENSPQTEPVSQFEDTKVFGPGSSFAFTLQEGPGLLRADPPHGEWHMHCHVPSHMMHGMVGSLLVVEGGELAFPLPEGQGVPQVVLPEPPRRPQTREVRITREAFTPQTVTIVVGDTVRWINNDVITHGIFWDGAPYATAAFNAKETYEQTFTKPGTFPYHCNYRDTHAHTGTVVVLASPDATPLPPSGGGTGSTGGGGATAITRDVTITSTGFSPSSLTIKAGDSLRWTNSDTAAHSATADDHSWMSPTLSSGKSFVRVFSAKGTFTYHCHIHHEMTASVTVT
jgi:plastocyanin/FtsP/CotA-like multicopper oxidase with cupredoxin domain